MRRCQMPGAAAAPCCRLFSLSLLPARGRSIVRFVCAPDDGRVGGRVVEGGGATRIDFDCYLGQGWVAEMSRYKASLTIQLEQCSKSRVASSLSEIASFCFFPSCFAANDAGPNKWTEVCVSGKDAGATLWDLLNNFQGYCL